MLNHDNPTITSGEQLKTTEEINEIVPFNETEIQLMISIYTFKEGIPIAYHPDEIKEYVNITGG
jgi:hypothetical protein